VEKLAAYVVREGGLSTEDAVGWVVRLTSTLEPIHGLGVSHGRVSAKAIQIEAPRCTSPGHLLDAGDLADDPAYFSAERIIEGTRSPSDDTWAAGVMLYRMLTGELPYRGSSIEEMRRLIAGPPPTPLAAFDVGDDAIQAILDRVFTSDAASRITRLSQLRDALVTARPRLANLPPLQYGRPDDDDDDDDGVLTTAVFNFDDEEGSDLHREAKRRIVGASALPDAGHAPRSVKPPRPPSAQAAPALQIEADAGLAIIDSAIPGHGPKRRAPAPGAPEPEPPPSPRVSPQPFVAAPPAAAPPAEEPQLPAPPPEEDQEELAAPPPEAAPEPPPAVADRAIQPAVEPVGDSASSQAHIASIEPPRKPPRRSLSTYALGALCVLVGAAAAYFVMGDDGLFTELSPTETEPAASASAPSASTSASTAPSVVPPSPAPTASAGASAPPDPSSAPSATMAAPLGETAACVTSLFNPDTFEGASPSFPGLCETANPIKGSKALRGEVVKAGGGNKGVTTGMRELSTMGWYGLAAFAIIRDQCCESPPPFKTPTVLECNLDHRLERLARDVNGGGDRASKRALEQVTKSFHCLARGGGADFFGQPGMPSGGELESFLQLYARARKRAMRKH
jgi:hypothetical protein